MRRIGTECHRDGLWRHCIQDPVYISHRLLCLQHFLAETIDFDDVKIVGHETKLHSSPAPIIFSIPINARAVRTGSMCMRPTNLYKSKHRSTLRFLVSNRNNRLNLIWSNRELYM